MAAHQLTISLDGCTLHAQTSGTGPILVIVPGGAGNADQADALGRTLEARFTVVSYDRRGVSRSQLVPGSPLPTIQTHANDLHHLIQALGSGPVHLFSTSIGCLVALDLLARYPQDVAILIAHEPPDVHLLAGTAREEADTALAQLQRTFQAGGVGAALQQFSKLIGIDPTQHEPDAPEIQVTPQFIHDMSFYFEHDLGAGRDYRVDLDALRAHRDQLIVGAGKKSESLWTHSCAAALARSLGQPLTLWPGGHNGPTAYPKASAQTIIEHLSTAPSAASAG